MNRVRLNRVRRTAMIAAALTTSAVAATAVAPAVLAAGTTEFTRKQVAAIVADVDPGQEAKCYIAGHADSDRAWAIMTYRIPAPRGCAPADGYWVVHKAASGWTDAVDVAVGVIPCRDLRQDLRKAKAPPSVFSDFKAAGVCTRD